LCGQEQLLLFAAECFEYILFPHVICSHIIAVNTQVRVTFCKLSRLDLCQAFNGLQTRVFCQCQRDVVQSICTFSNLVSYCSPEDDAACSANSKLMKTDSKKMVM